MSVKFTASLGGAERLIRELKLSVPRTRAKVVAAVHKNTEAVTAQTKGNIHSVTGELAGTVRAEYSESGLIGYVKAGKGKLPRRSKSKGVKQTKGRKRKTGEGAYAPVIDRGDKRRNIRAQHFMSRPFEQQKPKAIADISHALNDSMKDVTT